MMERSSSKRRFGVWWVCNEDKSVVGLLDSGLFLEVKVESLSQLFWRMEKADSASHADMK